MQQQPDGAVSADSAWRAAVERAKRVTEALIVAEAQLLEAGARVARLEQELADLREQHADRTEACESAEPCSHTEPGSPCDWNVCRQEVNGGGQSEAGSAGDVGAVVSAHAFSD